MVEEWMPAIQLPLPPEQFLRLPRNAAYKYTYLQGVAWINPRPRYYHALLSLPAALDGAANGPVRPVAGRDWEALAELFADAFADEQPFAGQDRPTRRVAAAEVLRRTATGGDGPWVERASFVAQGSTGRPLGAVLVTLLPPTDPTDWDSYYWEEPPPPDAIARCLGRPHLTWIFVDPRQAGRGIGTALLGACASALTGLGFTELVSTFMLGNDSSLLWHWRCGFRLLSYPGSSRRDRG